MFDRRRGARDECARRPVSRHIAMDGPMAERGSEDALARPAELLRQDVASTAGSAHEPMVNAKAAELREYDFGCADAELVERLVESVQQEFHDRFIHTTWPACPRHPNHPLWYRGGAWWCERDAVAIARLGGLHAAPGGADDAARRAP